MPPQGRHGHSHGGRRGWNAQDFVLLSIALTFFMYAGFTLSTSRPSPTREPRETSGPALVALNAAQDDAALRAIPDSLEPTPPPHADSQGGAPLPVKTDLAGHPGDDSSSAKPPAEEVKKAVDKEAGASAPHPPVAAVAAVAAPSEVPAGEKAEMASSTAGQFRNGYYTHPALRVLVLTYDRSKPLARLLKSLEEADYLGDRADLDVWVDVPPSGVVDAAVLSVANEAAWTHGIKKVHVRKKNVGLKTQWIHTWNESIPTGLHADTPEIPIILEDDMEVSKYFWTWLKKGHGKYKMRKEVAALTLQRASLCAANCAELHGGPKREEGYNFWYPLVGSWGYSPKADHWVRFTQQWLPAFEKSGKKPYVEGLTPTSWYKSFEGQKRCPGKRCMWTMLHLKYTSENSDRFTVYARAKGDKTLGANHREGGLHYGKAAGVDHQLVTEWTDPGLEDFPDEPLRLGLDGKENGRDTKI